MNRHFLRCTLATVAIAATANISAVAATNTWTNTFGNTTGNGPYWVNFAGYNGNWSQGTIPIATDDVVFQLPYVPSPAFAPFGPPFTPIADGKTIVLFPSTTFPPALVANSLTFTGSYKLESAAQVFNAFGFGPYTVEALTLSSGRVTVANGVTAEIDNPLASGTGTITKLGSGLLLLNDVPSTFSTLTGKTFPGSPAILGNLLVQQGAVGGNFTVTGNYTQTSKGGLFVQVASPTSFSHVTVGGTADLDGNLYAGVVNGYHPKKGTKFTILTSAQGVSGEFDSVTSTVWDNLTLHPFYSDNSVSLKVVVASFEQAGETRNQRAVGHVLDEVTYDHRSQDLIYHLYHRDLNDLPNQLDRIAPEELTSMFTMGVALAQVQSGNIQRRTDDIRSGSSGFSAGGLAVNGSGPSYSGSFRTGVAGPNGNGLRDDGKEVKETKSVVPEENRWGVFLSGTGEWISVGNTDNARGYDLNSGGFTLGIDYKVTPNFAIGIAAGYTGTTADLVDRGRVWVNGGKIGLYGTFFQNEQVAAAPTMSKDSSKEAPAPAVSIAKGFYADVAAFGGYNSYDTRRAGIQGEARGDTDGGELNVLFGMGYDFKVGGLTFGPTASFNYTYIGTNGFTEHGSLAPLDVHGGKGESLRSAFGLKASYDWKVGGILIKPEVRAAWQHEYGDAVYDIDSNFANGAGDSFLVSGPQVGRDSVLLGAGFAIQCSERFSTYFYYDGELGRKNYQSTAVTGGVRIAF